MPLIMGIIERGEEGGLWTGRKKKKQQAVGDGESSHGETEIQTLFVVSRRLRYAALQRVQRMKV